MARLLYILLFVFLLASCGDDDSTVQPDGEDDSGLGISEGREDPHGDGKSSGGVDANSSSSLYEKPVVVSGDSLIEDTTSVTSVNDLPECTAGNEGESFFVESENVLYFCLEKEWYTSDVVKNIFEIGCKDGQLKIGEDSEPETDAGTTSPWGGGYGFGGMNGGMNGGMVSTMDSAATPRRAGARIVGIVQKGPFRHGASVKIVELDSMQRLADSRRTHKTCILDSDGNYSFDSVDLVSPYLRLEANGYYRNELTGGLSPTTVTLNAVVDVTSRDTVNVNMLTHMEAPRVRKLVEDSGNNKPIGSVKATALQNVLNSFEIYIGGSSGGFNGGGFNGGGFNGWGFGQQQTSSADGRVAESISLFDGDEYSGALLAVSIMMQRNGSGNSMLQYTSGIAERIKGNGNWDDNQAKADLADWLLGLDTSNAFAAIRSNIALWNMGEVPDFEKHLRNFWTKIHGFGSCSAMNAGSVKHMNNSQSKLFCSYYEDPNCVNKTRFICDGSTHLWRAATDIEKDTVEFGMGEYAGQIRSGKINLDKYYVYDGDRKPWREATGDDIREFEKIEDVYNGLAPGEKVIFILRHAKRTDDTGKKGHLTDDGKKQSQSVGEKFKGENIYFANSTYTRSYETCENIAKGAGVELGVPDTIAVLDGEWYVKDESKFESYKNSDGGGWNVVSAYAYKEIYADAFYDFKSKSEEFMETVVKPGFAKVSRVGIWISHDVLVAPITVFGTDKKVNLRYFDTKQWVNYLAGLAIIMDVQGNLRYVPVKGLDVGTMTL